MVKTCAFLVPTGLAQLLPADGIVLTSKKASKMKQLFIFLLFLCSTSISAQDVIVKKDGSTIVCRVVELTSSEIVYNKWSDLNGSNYVMNRADASTINYQNGKKVNLSEATNLYQPHNQNDGVQLYNDRALLELDKAITSTSRVRKMRTIGWIGGTVAVVAGGILLIHGNSNNGDEVTHSGGTTYVKGRDRSGAQAEMVVGGILMGVGVAFTTTFLILAHKEKRKMNGMISYNPILQHGFQLNNGSSLIASLDMINNHSLGEKTLGLSLLYNF